MSKGAIGLRHLVSVVALLDRVALAGSGVLDSWPSASAIGIPRRLFAYCTIQRIASETWRAGVTSIGT